MLLLLAQTRKGFLYKKYQQCSDSKWHSWRDVFLGGRMNGTISNVTYIALLTYYWDNGMIEEYSQ